MVPGVRRNRQALVATGLTAIVVVLILYLFRGAFIPFIFGGILAYMFHPVVKAVEGLMPWRRRRPGLSRTIAILIICGNFLGVVAGVLAIVIPPALGEGRDFIASAPEFYSRARATVERWNQEYATRVPEDVRNTFEDALTNFGNAVMRQVEAALKGTIGTLSSAFGFFIGLAIIPVFLYYLLKDREALAEGVSATFPAAIRPHALSILDIVNRVLGAYVRAQLLLGLVVGTMVFLGLFFLRIKFSVLLAIIAGFTEFIPIIGPLLGAIPGILVTLATSPEKTIWVVLVYVGVQQLENSLLVPRIQGQSLNIHPIVVMVVIVVGSQIAGLWGIIVGPPLAATAIAVVKYFRQEWDREMPPLEAVYPIKPGVPAEGVASEDDDP